MASQMSKTRERDVELPDEILFEILSLLPAKSVCISKCCSKSFLHFTNSTNFALKQSQNSLLKDDSYLFIQNRFIDDGTKNNTEIHSLLPSSSSTIDQKPREKVGVTYCKFLDYVDENTLRILASNNGLLLCQTPLRKGNGQLFICNPITQSHSFIPSPIPLGLKHYPRGVIFSFQCNDNDEGYKLYALECDYVQSPRSVVCKMYIPKEGVWKEIETSFILGEGYFMYNQLPVFCNGAIHFIIIDTSRWHQHLASYNVESGVSRIIEVPDGAMRADEDERWDLFKWCEVGSKKESICLVNLKRKPKVGYDFSVQVLSNYESLSGGNWSKILSSVNLKELGLDREYSRVLGFTIMNGRSLVFATETEVYACDLSGKRETRLEKVCDHKLSSSKVTLLPYSDTLRSCGIDSTNIKNMIF